MHRGDVVVVDFGSTVAAANVRPALVVQNDRDNARTNKTIVVQITGNLRRAHEDTHHLIDEQHPDWPVSGLRMPSVVNGSALFYVHQADIRRVIGRLTAPTMLAVTDGLKAALGIP